MTRKVRKLFGDGSKELHRDQYEVLEGKGTEDERFEVMDMVQDYLEASYFLGINGVAQLRAILPQYEWVYFEVKNLKKVQHIVRSSDFVWLTPWSTMPYWHRLPEDLDTLLGRTKWPDEIWDAEEFSQIFVEWAKADENNVLNFVSATSKESRENPLSYFFAGSHDESAGTPKRVEFVRSVGGQPIYAMIQNR